MRSYIALAAVLLVSAASSSGASDQEVESEDPHLWLEDVEGEEALEWVRGRNAEATSTIQADPGFEAMQQRLLSMLDSPDKIAYLERKGEDFYNFWKEALHHYW